MVATNFEKSLKRVLVHEGGYSNHPDDPGGPTMKGVIQRVYDGYRNRQGLQTRSVQFISQSEIEDIYRKQYWDAIRGDDLPHGVDFVVFDGAVNSGPSQSAKWLQRTLDIKADGNIGEATVAAALAGSRASIINGVCDRRMEFLKALKTWPTFGKGWARRVADVRKTGLAFAKIKTPEPTPEPLPDEPGSKAELPPAEEKKDRGLLTIIGAILANIGLGVADFLGVDWKILVAIVGFSVFLLLFLGRDWVRKRIEERL